MEWFARNALEREGGVAEDSRQKIVEVVSDAASQHAQAFELMAVPQVLLELPAFGDVAGHVRCADDAAGRVADRGNGERDIDETAAGGAPDRLKVFDAIPAPDAPENLSLLVLTVVRQEQHHRAADHLVRLIAVDSLRTRSSRSE